MNHKSYIFVLNFDRISYDFIQMNDTLNIPHPWEIMAGFMWLICRPLPCVWSRYYKYILFTYKNGCEMHQGPFLKTYPKRCNIFNTSLSFQFRNIIWYICICTEIGCAVTFTLSVTPTIVHCCRWLPVRLKAVLHNPIKLYIEDHSLHSNVFDGILQRRLMVINCGVDCWLTMQWMSHITFILDNH